jgi:PAS domain-containing protein
MRYFFHYLAGEARFDDLGLDHADSDSAKAEAIRAAREMMADALRRNEKLPADGVIEVTDERGNLVAHVALPDAAFGAVPHSRYRRIFDHAPECYLVLSRDMTIVEANPAHLRATMTDLAAIVRRPLFDAFPPGPGDAYGRAMAAISDSLQAVLREKAAQVVSGQRYDIRRPDGSWEERHWTVVSTPIFDAAGAVEFILQRVEDVTLACSPERSRAD